MARNAKLGRVKAMRRSMLALIDKGEPHETRSAYWAPLVVVGQGGCVGKAGSSSAAVKVAGPGAVKQARTTLSRGFVPWWRSNAGQSAVVLGAELVSARRPKPCTP
jgi:hypothetical protein